MFQRHAPLAIRFDGSSFQLNWMWQMLKNCNTEHYMTNKGRMVRTAEYSRDCIKALRQETGISTKAAGAARCSCSAPSNSSKTQRKTLRYWKMPGCLTNCWRPASSPALSRRWPVAHKLTGGLQLPNDETGDCQLFTQQLAKMAEQAGVTFLFNRSVDRLLVEGDKIAGVQCGEEVFKADSYVVAFGSYSTALLRGTVSIPVYPLKGYSLTIPITDEAAAPFSTVLDETYKIAITRFDQRIRVGGMAEIVGFNTQLEQNGVKRWRWWYAISTRTAAEWRTRRSGPACGR